jgi:hypothetical protein
MYEHRTEPLLTRAQFARRLLRHGGVAALMVGDYVGQLRRSLDALVEGR